MSFLYFAYGSNLLPARLAARCPGARIIGKAFAPEFGLDFSKIGADGSGKATLVPATGAQTPGILYEIADDELGELDRAEGAGSGYSRIDDFTVGTGPGGERLCATTYIADAKDAGLLPYDWYLALVIAGARHQSLDRGHQARLGAQRYVEDTEPGRLGRRQALEAFLAHGIQDHRGLLGAGR